MTTYDFPPATRWDLVEKIHGQPVADPYRWLEDHRDPDTVAWSAAQRELFERVRAGWRGYDELCARLNELSSFDAYTLPRARGQRLFYGVRRRGAEHVVVCCTEADGTARVLLDPMQLDPTGLTTPEAWRPSLEGDLLAYQVAGGGTEDAQLWVIDVATGKLVDGPIGRVRRSPLAWLPGGEAFYYVRRLPPEQVPVDERQYHRRVYLHRLGTDPDTDVLIFGDGRDKADYYSVRLSPDGRWLTISATAGTARGTDLWLADLTESGPAMPRLRPVQQGVDAKTVPYIRGGAGPDDQICVFTEREDGYGRMVATTPAGLAGGAWRELIPEQPPAVLTDFAVLDGPALARAQLLVVRHRHTIAEVTVHDLATGEQIGTVPLPGSGTVAHIVDRLDGGHQAWFTYAEYGTPTVVYCYDALTGEAEPWGEPAMPDLPSMVTQQVVYRSADGTPVRMFIVSADGAADRPRPTILTGYGGFGVRLAPDYQPLQVAWVEAGGVLAVAHVRGGGEEGESWHRSGARGNRLRSFDDFAAAADWLVDNGWTTRPQLGVLGMSNGGLLTGAALTRYPDKWSAVVSTAGLLDMVRYERFGLGPSWRAEFGTVEDPQQLAWLLSYSPYHHVRDGTPYPAVLLNTFDGDTRVDPMHARKMCAALQHATTSGRAVLLRAESGVGHSQRALSRGVVLSADILAFFATELGLTELCRSRQTAQAATG